MYRLFLLLYCWFFLAAPVALCQENAPNIAPLESSASENNKLTVSGYVVSGGDTTPEGLLDTPRKFVYKIKLDNGGYINVVYTAYPPSPTSEQEEGKFKLKFYAGSILNEDYLKASGTFDKETNTLVVAEESDYIETFQKQ